MTEPTIDDNELLTLIGDIEAAGKRVRAAGKAGGKAVNLPMLIGGDLIPILLQLAKQLHERDADHDERLEAIEDALGYALEDDEQGHPFAEVPALAARELLQMLQSVLGKVAALKGAPDEQLLYEVASVKDMVEHVLTGGESSTPEAPPEEPEPEPEAAEPEETKPEPEDPQTEDTDGGS